MKNITVLQHIVLFLSFIILTLAFFMPFIPKWDEDTVGSFDTYWSLWAIWHFSYQIDHAENPFHTTLIFSPLGANLFLSQTPLISFFLSYPLNKIFGLFGTYNILLLSSFVLSGYCAYLLLFYLTKNCYGSFLGATIFSFSSQHLAQAVRHLNLVHIEFVPLFFLYLIQALKEGRKRDWVISAAILGFMAYIEIRIFMMTLLVSIPLIYYLKSPQVLIKAKENISIFALILFLIILPYAIISMKELFLEKNIGFSSLAMHVFYSPDILGFIIPPPQSFFFGNLTKYFYDMVISQRKIGNSMQFFWDIDLTNYMGISALVLSIIAWKSVKEIDYIKKTMIWTCVLLLGPLPWVAGNLLPIILPYLPFFLIPGLNILRVPTRFDLLFMLFIGILAGFGFSILSTHMKKIEIGLFAFLLFLIIIENYAYFPTLDKTYNSFYNHVINEKKGTIIYVPFYPNLFDERTVKLIYLQTIHKNKINVGGLTITPQSLYHFYTSGCNKELYTINFSTCKKNDFMLPEDAHYLIYTKEYEKIYSFNLQYANATLTKEFGNAIYEDNELSVFCINKC